MNATWIRNVIEARVFVPYGFDVLYAPLIAPSLNEWGDNVKQIGLTPWNLASSSTIHVCPANAFNTQEIFYQFGNLEKGDQDILIRPTQSFGVGDLIITTTGTVGSYRVKKFSDYVVGDVNIFYYVRLNEII
jgi:hypothetical protein